MERQSKRILLFKLNRSIAGHREQKAYDPDGDAQRAFIHLEFTLNNALTRLYDAV